MKKINKERVIVAMSGGIDSSVTAALLKEWGYEVVGLYLRPYKQIGADEDADLRRVKKIARYIGIQLKILDVRKEFKKKVIDYFLEEYKRGNTPNPCVVCNKEIKFRFLFQELSKQKADFVATGHYARVMKHGTRNMKHNIYKLFKARDKTKDQSYFLYRLNQKELARVIFPLGNYTKQEVKKLAKKFKLPIGKQKESQNVCFIDDKHPDNFIKKHIRLKEGDIVDNEGKVISKHKGLPLYTIGQRRSINIGGTGPYYVVSKDSSKNRLIVTNKKDDPALFQKSVKICEAVWGLNKPKSGDKILVKIRYRHPAVRGIIRLVTGSQSIVHGHCIIEFQKPQRAVAPGQSAVIYSEKGEVLGGGIIA